MDPIEEKLEAELRRARDAYRARADKLVGEDTTGKEAFLAHLRQEHGPASVGGEEAPPAPEPADWIRRLQGLFLRFALPATALTIVAVALWVGLAPSGMVLSVDPGDRAVATPGKPVLPGRLRIHFERQRIEIYGGGDKLVGTLYESNTVSSAEIAAYRVAVSGKDATGLEGKFEGWARFTRAEPGGSIRRKADIKKVVLEGDLTVGGAGTFPVKRTYIP